METSVSSSTGAIVQPSKKKRTPTNPNNIFKPSSDSTTPRNLCGIEWQAEHKTGTIAEFAAHWNSLTAKQKESYTSCSKLVDAAKANIAEFIANVDGLNT
ncbi:hypothetical protein BD769DRAFT_1779458 [Suillus cothurnatus]|nr:hypothetical protein BD769DRAFT_1779458 [Suillus cothurnatus]